MLKVVCIDKFWNKFVCVESNCKILWIVNMSNFRYMWFYEKNWRMFLRVYIVLGSWVCLLKVKILLV